MGKLFAKVWSWLFMKAALTVGPAAKLGFGRGQQAPFLEQTGARTMGSLRGREVAPKGLKARARL